MTRNKAPWAKLAFGVVGALALLGTQTKSNAGVIYNSGTPDPSNGNQMTEWIEANEFTFGTSENITGIKFGDIESPGSYEGSITWIIYSNDGGAPGTEIASGNTSSVTRISTGVVDVFDLNEYVDTFSISASLGAGTYWLGLHNGPLSDQDRKDFYWENTSNLSQPSGYQLMAPFTDGWVNNGNPHTFELLNGATVPLPASAWGGLALMGGIGLLQIRRKMLGC